MKKILVTLMMGALMFIATAAYASVADRIYTEGGMIQPVGGMIDTNSSQNSLNSVGLSAAGTINHKADGGSYSAIAGYEAVKRSWYDVCVEMQATAANFRWDGEPLAVYSRATLQRLGTIYTSEERNVQFYSGNLKARFKLGFIRPFAELCGGPMVVKSTARTYRTDRLDLRNTTSETAMAAKLGGGIGFLILPSKLDDRVELVFSGAYVHGVSGSDVAEMIYAYYGGSLKIKFL